MLESHNALQGEIQSKNKRLEEENKILTKKVGISMRELEK